MATKTNRAKSAKANEAKQAAKQAKTIEATAAVIEDVSAVDVETIETQEATTAAALPVATETETETGKVSSKEVLKAAGSLRAAVKEERRGANVTIRLIAERAAAGDTAAVNILCALCDVPRAALFTLNVDKVRAAVNAYYPYFVEVENHKVSVKPVGVWYSTNNGNETQEDASKRVQRGYIAAPVSDYLDQLIFAAKCRAKGVQPRRVDVDAVYSDNKLSTAAAGIAAAEIEEAKKRRAYSAAAVNVWKRDRNGFYI